MPTIEYNGMVYSINERGFLSKGLEEWDENWADYVKGMEGVSKLTDEYWRLISILQRYYRENGDAPTVRTFFKHTGFVLNRVHQMFPSSGSSGACKMAGLPRPKGSIC